MKAATTLTTKEQVVIPKEIRDHLRWKPGTRLEVRAEPDGSLRMQATPLDAIDRGFGFLTRGDPLGDLEAEHRSELEEDRVPQAGGSLTRRRIADASTDRGRVLR